jgi:hypothetical protein
MEIKKKATDVYEINFSDGVKTYTGLELIRYLCENGYQKDDLITIHEVRDIKLSNLLEDQGCYDKIMS